MKIGIIIALAAVALSGCAAGSDYKHETTQPFTVQSTAGAICTGTRDGEQLFAAPSGQVVTITKSKSALQVACVLGQRRAAITVASSADSLSMSPLWDYASGAFNKYPAEVFVDLGSAK
jgi:hypothetical protein